MARNERAQWAQLHIDGVTLLADLAAGASLARLLEFVGPQLRCFGAAAASSKPLVVGDFSGRVDRGASCNCSVLTLTPHANGTHTEGVGHLTAERVDVQGLIPHRLLIAALLSIEPELAGDSARAAHRCHAPRSADHPRAIEGAWPAALAPQLKARAAVIIARCRTSATNLPKSAPRRRRSCRAKPPGGWSRTASSIWCSMCPRRIAAATAVNSPRTAFSSACRRQQLVARGAAPQEHDHRARLCPDALADGWYFLSLQSPAIAGDAVPSRPGTLSIAHAMNLHAGCEPIPASRLDWARSQDAADALAPLRARFALPRGADGRRCCTSAVIRSGWRRWPRAP
jgi:hypothetical protein